MTTVMPSARYTTTRGDLFRFNVYHYLHSWGYMTFQIVVLALLSHSFYRALPPEAPLGVRFLVFGIFFFLGVVFLVVVFLASVATSVFSKKNKIMTTEHTISLKENGILEETPFHTTEYTWAAVQRLRRTRSYIFIYVARNLANVVPRRAFDTEQEWNAFFAFCREKSQKA